MRLLVGGAGQGKRAYAHTVYGYPEEAFGLTPADDCPVLDRLHELVRALLQAGGNPAELLEPLCQKELILCDEVGCGVVPLDRFERDWREQVGRLCRQLAARAESVERVTCGIAVYIRGGPL